jgi:hypothetical protein
MIAPIPMLIIIQRVDLGVISAKKEETRLKRLATLIQESEQGRSIAPLRRPGKSSQK